MGRLVLVLICLLASVANAQTPPANVGPQGTVGPAGAPSINCDGNANCCECAAAGNCVAGAGGTCNHTGTAWEASLEASHAGHNSTTETFLFPNGTYTATTVQVPSGVSATVRMVLANLDGATATDFDASFRFDKPGHLDVTGLIWDKSSTAGDGVVVIGSTNATAYQDIHFKWMHLLGGGNDGIQVYGNVDDLTFDNTLLNGGSGSTGSTIKIQCHDAEAGAGNSPDGEPAACEYAPTNVKVRHSDLRHNHPNVGGEDIIQFEGAGDGCELSHSVLRENQEAGVPEDCIDVKGQGTVGAVLTISNNIVWGVDMGGGDPAISDGCDNEAIQVQGNRSRPEDLILDGNYIVGNVTQDGSTQGIWRNNAFTGNPSTLDIPRIRLSAQFEVIFQNNTVFDGKFDIGNAPDRECPRLTIDNNVFDGTDMEGNGESWQTGLGCGAKCVGGIWDGSGEGCTCSVGGQVCHRHGDRCSSNGLCDCVGDVELCTADTDCDADLDSGDSLCAFKTCTANGVCEDGWPTITAARNNVVFGNTDQTFIEICVGGDNDGALCRGTSTNCAGGGTCTQVAVSTQTGDPAVEANAWQLPAGSSSAKGNGLTASTPSTDIQELARGVAPYDIGADEATVNTTTTTTTTLPSLWFIKRDKFYLRATGDGSAPETKAGAFDAADFNTAGNWDTDVANDGKIGPGDEVVILNNDGLISATLTFQGSGLLGEPIRLIGETPGAGVSGSIVALDKSYIRIEGLTATNATGVSIDIQVTTSGTIDDIGVFGNVVSNVAGDCISLSAAGAANVTNSFIDSNDLDGCGGDGIVLTNVTGTSGNENQINDNFLQNISGTAINESDTFTTQSGNTIQ